MSVEFSRSMRSLNRDGFRRTLAGFALAMVLLSLWVVWFFRAEVTRYEVTDRARLETESAGYEIQAPVAGRVVSSNLSLGRNVQAGDILMEIETDAQKLDLHETEARQAALRLQLQAQQGELTAQEQTVVRERQASAAAIEQSQAQYREAEVLRDLADQEADRSKRLAASGLSPARDQERAVAEARSRRANVESLALSTTRLEREQAKAQSEREATMQQLRVEISRLEGELMSLGKTVERQQFEVVRRQIRAPAAGRLGDAAILHPGGYVDEGDKLAVLIPSGGVRIVAEFLPPAALGRIHPGQKASMRLEGFPWTQYGTVRATVERAGDEVRDGRVRVELRVDDPSAIPIALQHGLPGSVEVQVETITPAVLALRTAGQLLSRPEKQYP
jgi:membrane fusion protein (multidrug efflux system)